MVLEAEDVKALDLVKAIRKFCPSVVLPKRHEKAASNRLRDVALRFPSQSKLFRDLENRGKLLKPGASKIKLFKIKQSQMKYLKGLKHRNVKDDRHILEAAIAERAAIITKDQFLRMKRGSWKKEFGVEVYRMDEVEW